MVHIPELCDMENIKDITARSFLKQTKAPAATWKLPAAASTASKRRNKCASITSHRKVMNVAKNQGHYVKHH